MYFNLPETTIIPSWVFGPHSLTFQKCPSMYLFSLEALDHIFNLPETTIMVWVCKPTDCSEGIIPAWGFWSMYLTCQRPGIIAAWEVCRPIKVWVYKPTDHSEGIFLAWGPWSIYKSGRDHYQIVILSWGFWSTKLILTEITIQLLFQPGGLGPHL